MKVEITYKNDDMRFLDDVKEIILNEEYVTLNHNGQFETIYKKNFKLLSFNALFNIYNINGKGYE